LNIFYSFNISKFRTVIFNVHFIIFSLFLSTLFVTACSEEAESFPVNKSAAAVDTIKLNEFGINVENLIEFRSTVKKNETLTDILLPFNVFLPDVYKIAKASIGVFDVRKINPGKAYTAYVTNDSLKQLKYFVYENSPLEYTVFDLIDTIKVIQQIKPVAIVEKELVGTIKNSLYETMMELNSSIQLALKLSEVYAWQIDFYGIQRGDYFKVIYDEEYVDGKFFRVGEIKAAYFNHRGTGFYGFLFNQEGKFDYFDEEGNSVQKQFLKAPLKFSRISSRYTGSRFHPILKRYRPHRGIDYAAPLGTPVMAVGDGRVIEKRYSKSAGYFLKVRHNGTYTSGYLHLSKYANGIRTGSMVKQGDIIGYVGSTGLSTGPHLDFRFWKNSSLVNYLNLEFPSSHPVDNKHKPKFESLKNIMYARLSMLPFPFDKNEIAYSKTE
jgi:murein DD-endopeptidase MepM/ murein hydrolase activator NlpD